MTACALQSCLSSNTYSPEKCDRHLRKLYLCCSEMYHNQSSPGDGVKTTGNESSACPMPSVVGRWLKHHPEGNKSSR
ncbi:hypothetical protein BV22DRAFT_1002429 [Leucogyrophana mollusca]|uniref:Uncharacterized protein n=1 Tax=Leucogyrophana mollusca TaxID=85980 RepID=A0ACB8BUZ7_9AGAM|nr:hypothetical protein BV22DRAFT_1002429 [Leucogyrophana mollusca]